MGVVMDEWLCRKKGFKLMENGKVQEAVSCDLLLGISKNIIKGSGKHKAQSRLHAGVA